VDGKEDDRHWRDFLRHNPLEDKIYLKDYVRQHPDNKMAWYLLGREYASRGESGKAAYCFSKSAEVYEAFESGPASLLPLKPDGKLLRSRPRQWPAAGAVSRLLRPLVTAAAALLLLLYVPEWRQPMPSSQESGAPATEQALPASSASDGEQGGPSQPAVYYLSRDRDRLEIGGALADIAMPGPLPAEDALIVQPVFSADGRWRAWLNPPPVPLLEVERGKQTSGQLQVRSLDPSTCNCQADDPGNARQNVRIWQDRQEELVVLSSAIHAYALKNGRLSDTIDQLSRAYPDNLLPGYTDFMQKMFMKMREREDKPSAQSNSDTTGSSSVGPTNKAQTAGEPAAPAEPLQAPLRIVVDKTVHRLALISGNVILRNYPVGLGGGRTPEGDFIITEKVRNPNGKSTGDFGSRGMTLSDTLYAIHGTDQPSSIGKDQSLGCVRMRQEDIEELFDMAPLGTEVKIGKGLLPPQIQAKDQPFRMPLLTQEENPYKTYKWLE
jgi:hypothetical protein